MPKGLPKEILDTFYERLYPTDQTPYGSQTGFLKEGEKLQDIVEKDRKTLLEYGVSYEKIYRVMSDIIDEARSNGSGWKPVIVQKKFAVQIFIHFGSQFCPFSLVKDDYGDDLNNSIGACGRGSQVITIKNTENGKSITFGSLLLHLIRDHHFFEGDVRYGASPKDIIETLEIEREENLQLPPLNTLSFQPKLINIIIDSDYYHQLSQSFDKNVL